MDKLPDTLNRLSERLDLLERRVHLLEHPAGALDPLPTQESNPSPVFQATEKLTVSLAGGGFSVLGKAMLGIAGAYLLRAMAESSLLPRTAVTAVAILYAIAWLVLASRAKAGDWLAGTTYACTSALILAPMLWELTVRFKVLPSPIAAGVLCGFVITASALVWKRDSAPILWVANVTAVAIALTLAISSHQMAPFITVLLLMVVICELGAERNRGSGVRVLVMLAADVAIWALIYIYSSPQSTRTNYPLLGMATLLAPGFTLFLILGVGLISRTLLKRKTITAFETIQGMIAFLLAASSLLYFGPPGSVITLGIFCVVLSDVTYAAALIVFDRTPHRIQPERVLDRRNYLVFVSWSAVLFLGGSLMCLPPSWLTPWLGTAALVATFVGVQQRRLALELHGLVFLLVVAALSGLLTNIFSALAGTLPGAPSWDIYFVSACAILSYEVLQPSPERSWKRQVLATAFASLAICVAAALLVQGFVAVIALSVVPAEQHVAFIRTFTVCAMALALAFSGSYWRRTELTRIGYATLALLAVKLVFEDLRVGHLGFIAGSIFLFAITLIAVPRVARMGQKV